MQDETAPAVHPARALPHGGDAAVAHRHDSTPSAVGDPLAFLAGSWHTERRLLDRAGGLTGTFTGTTTFTPDDDGLRWEEEGIVAWPQFQGPAVRTYLVRRVRDGSALVHFPDGRLLCRLDLTSGRAYDEHACAPDTYRVRFTATSATTVEYSWDVTGPAKDLLLTTVLTRE
ncbi:hypothetical protein CVO76_09575 [Arthrobacter agilis]|uniref:DUF6314 domain-containing protein n=1 Tax=Arthrobacter agilis TaxID=37921 RepID=A0A2L0UF58_9MICC|nr:DUF6314 family protein [Arthrobacter agilis]AUZ87852.1 hypothetical protein CVO76_09575 [Arthrobacter agilis]